MTATRKIVVHIDRLVLRGFERAERHVLAAALERELARALAAPDGAERLASHGHLARLQVPDVRLGGVAAQQGAQLGRSIGKELLR
jgi:hypothetical protein